jgi:HSP20 family protein
MTICTLVPSRTGRVVHHPFWGLRGGFDDLLERFERDFGFAPRSRRGSAFAPRVNIEEEDGKIRVTAELPGLDEQDFDVSLEDEVLTIKGEKKLESEEKREGLYRAERSSGSFSRAFRIPWEVDPEAVEATFERGVLTVTVPKPARPEPRTIPVTTS